MGSPASFVCYVAVVGSRSLAPVYGAIWLARPAPSLKAEARAAPIPPRIAESIERKKDAHPRAEPVEVKPPPPMTEANVALVRSLPPAPRPVHHVASPHRAKTKQVPNPNVALRPIATDADAASPRPLVTTARTDSPY
jgi:hypothetical protein